MVREIHQWYSPALSKEMPVAVYGHYGFALLMVPTAAADYLEYERFELINALKPFIDAGKLKIFSVNSINTESWMNKQIEGAHKAIRQNQFNEYIYNEVIPFIQSMTSQDTPIITCGASFGAFHSMNLFLKRPDLINGVIAMTATQEDVFNTVGSETIQLPQIVVIGSQVSWKKCPRPHQDLAGQSDNVIYPKMTSVNWGSTIPSESYILISHVCV